MWLQSSVLTALVLTTLAATAHAIPRDVQVRSANVATGVIELHNFGGATESISGWRLCTANSSVSLQYTGTTGFSGRSLASGASLRIHTLNDAPGGDPDAINVSSLGGLFAAIGPGAYGLGLYQPTFNFADPSKLADYLQWNLGGAHDAIASIRANIAVTAGLWPATTDWVSTTPTSISVKLDDTTGGTAHSPSDYTVTEPAADPVPALPAWALAGFVLVLATSLRLVMRRTARA